MKTEIDVKLIEEALNEIKRYRKENDGIYLDVGLIYKCLKQAIAQAPQFYKGQQGLFSNDGVCWYKGMLLDVIDGRFMCKVPTHARVNWKYFKPNPEAVTLPVWLPYSCANDLPDVPLERIVMDKAMYTVVPPYEVLS